MTEEAGGLQSTGLQRVGHDWNDYTAATHKAESQESITVQRMMHLECPFGGDARSKKFYFLI